MNAENRKRCPYTLSPLTALPRVSREHVVLDGLGGPDGYAVAACEAENNTLGSSVDAAFLKDPIVAILRIRAGVETRSGESKWIVEGTTVEGQRPVQATFTANSVEVYHRKPVEKVDTPEGGKSFRITAGVPQSREELAKIQKSMAKKGFTMSEPQVEQSPSHVIEAQSEINLSVMEAGLMKIAYLACFEYLGDAFLDDPLNGEWQRAIRATSADELQALSIKRVFAPPLPSPVTDALLSPLNERQHGIAIVSLPMGLQVTVRLFGEPLLTLTASASETSDFGLGVGTGVLVVIDADTGAILREPWEKRIHAQGLGIVRD